MIGPISLIGAPGNHESASAATTLFTTYFGADKTLFVQIGNEVNSGIRLSNSNLFTVQPEP
jgi:hypothetical protein